jgi:putative transposase
MVRPGSRVRVPFQAPSSLCRRPGPGLRLANMCSAREPTARKAFRYQLCPTTKQRVALARAAGARRFVFNWALRRWLDFHREHSRTISRRQLSRELTQLKHTPGYRWMQEIDSQLLQQALADVRAAFNNFFERRAGFPRFKSRKADRDRFRIPQRVVVRGNKVRVPKIGWVRIRLSRPIEGNAKSATFSRDGSGLWHVSLVSEIRPAAPLSRPPTKPVGLDLGIVDLATLSDGRRIGPPPITDAERRRVRRARRALSRSRPGGRRRGRRRVRLARLERRLANRRRDFVHKLTSELVRDHDLIAIEDLGVRGLARTKLSRALHELSLRELRRQLEYKARWTGKPCVVVPRFFPSSKKCSDCGQVNASLTPRERQWACVCGVVHDRDLNAARNILAVGLAEHRGRGAHGHSNARGASVSLPTGAASNEARILDSEERQHGSALPTRSGTQTPQPRKHTS